MKFLTEDDIERLHIEIIDASGGAHGVRDRGRINSAVTSQKQAVFGEELYKSIYEKAAVLTRGIVKDRPFIDGNKRTGVTAGLLFMELNGYDMAALIDRELEEFTMHIAINNPEISEIAAWFKRYSKEPEK